MHTQLSPELRGTAAGEEAAAILRNCVHCGFCTATCPTYQLEGDELDGPRGRIYLIKQVLEGKSAGASTQHHLDRCLGCRSCETTCPSGVEYGRLLDIGRALVDAQVRRPPLQRAVRAALREVLPRRWLFKPVLRAGQAVRGLLPASLRGKVPEPQRAGPWPTTYHARKVIIPAGCVQQAMAPDIDAAAARVLDAVGVQAVRPSADGCCGALRMHLGAHAGALDDARRNIDAWWPAIEAGAEAVVTTASGCGAMVKEYGHMLRADPAYALRAERVSALALDLSVVLWEARGTLAAQLAGRESAGDGERVAYHAPCSLQHGQQVRGKAEALLQMAGVDLAACGDSHLCCGSAGTYSLLQPELSHRLRQNKLARLSETGATRIVSANIGCQTHLQSGTATPVEHWIALLDRRLNGKLALQATVALSPCPGS